MIVEILFQEVCGLYGDSQNPTYLQATLPEAEFVFTKLTDKPYFVDNTPQLIYIGCMSESIQRRVIEKLLPHVPFHFGAHDMSVAGDEILAGIAQKIKQKKQYADSKSCPHNAG